MTGCVESIETFGTVDGPGIRTVVFLSGCKLRCIYCHNPEMWMKQENNITSDELVCKILKNKNYFGEYGGVTFSGGEPLLQIDFLIDVCKKLKENNINIALDTAGVGLGNYNELLKYVDLIILDIKHTNVEGYKQITNNNIKYVEDFIIHLNKSNKDVWIRQVIVPGFMDNDKYLISLKKYISKINNIRKIEFLPYHKLGEEKYKKIGIIYPCNNIKEMNKNDCQKLYNKFVKLKY